MEADFSGKINVRLPTRLRSQKKTEEFCLGQTAYFYTERKSKGEKRRQGPGIITACYGNQYSLVHLGGHISKLRWAFLKSTGKVLDVF